jgi:hypothetical protein
VSSEAVEYKLGEFALSSPIAPEQYLAKALELSRSALRQRNPMAALQVSNPFQMEPAAQGVFMLVCRELELLRARVQELEAQLEHEEEK